MQLTDARWPASAQLLPGENKPFGWLENVTLPVGVDVLPASTSVTVTSHVVGVPIDTGVGVHLIAEVVPRVVTVSVPEILLDRCVLSPA